MVNSSYSIQQVRLSPLATARGRVRAGFLTGCALGAMMGILHAQGDETASMDPASLGAYRRAAAKASEKTNDALDLIEAGDSAAAKGDLEEATLLYRGAYDKIPKSPALEKWREHALAKFARASVELAEQRIEEGRHAEATEVLELVVGKGYAEDYAPARKALKRLKNPDYYNREKTPEHLAKVREVEALIKRGRSQYLLGRVDAATATYLKILSIDPFNRTARRALTQLEDQMSEYYRGAYLHTRASLMKNVDEAWESPVVGRAALGLTGGGVGGSVAEKTSLAEKLRRIRFPKVEFNGTTLEEVVEYLGYQSRALDPFEAEPSKKGVNIVLALPPEDSQRKVNLNLRNVSLDDILYSVGQIANVRHRVEGYAVRIVPASDVDQGLLIRTYTVPPNFISSSALPGDGGVDSTDPFAPGGDGVGLGGPSRIVKKLSAQEFLEQSGIIFPPGSMAHYVPAGSQVVMRNTLSNHQLLEGMIDSSKSSGAKQIRVTVKMIEANHTRFEELGFDWLLGAFNVPGNSRVFGGGGTQGWTASQPQQGQVGSDFPFMDPTGQIPIGRNPITSGNRSGLDAISSNAIDALLQDERLVTSRKSPGVFALAGVFTDPQFQLVIRALNRAKGVDILNAPSVVTRSGQRAKVEVIREFTYPTEFEPPEIPTNFGGNGGGAQAIPITPATPTAFETTNLGSTMEVEPTLNPDNITVDVQLAPQFRDFEGFVDYGSPILINGSELPNQIIQPVFRTNRVTTGVSVYDGHTIVIGGVKAQVRQDINDKTPILGDLPLIGRLFRSKVSVTRNKAVVIFVTVHVLDAGGQPLNRPSSIQTAGGGRQAPVISLKP